MRLLTRLGQDVEIVLRTKPHGQRRGRILWTRKPRHLEECFFGRSAVRRIPAKNRLTPCRDRASMAAVLYRRPMLDETHLSDSV